MSILLQTDKSSTTGDESLTKKSKLKTLVEQFKVGSNNSKNEESQESSNDKEHLNDENEEDDNTDAAFEQETEIKKENVKEQSGVKESKMDENIGSESESEGSFHCPYQSLEEFRKERQRQLAKWEIRGDIVYYDGVKIDKEACKKYDILYPCLYEENGKPKPIPLEDEFVELHATGATPFDATWVNWYENYEKERNGYDSTEYNSNDDLNPFDANFEETLKDYMKSHGLLSKQEDTKQD